MSTLALAAPVTDQVDALMPPHDVDGRSSDREGATAAEVLHRVALTVNSSLDIKEVLDRLARLALEAVPANRCAIFLIDETATKLVPSLAIGQVDNADLWQRFRALPAIDLLDVPERGALFAAGRALAVPDLACSPLVPAGISDVFEARSALLAPLVAGGEAVGILTLDWTVANRAFPAHETGLIEAVAAYAALAVRNARLYEGSQSKARTLGRLFELASTLNSSSSLRSVLDLICNAYEELLGTTHCSVNLIGHADGARLRTLAVRGVPWFADDEDGLSRVPAEEVARVNELWSTAARPIVYADGAHGRTLVRALAPGEVRSVALFPLIGPDGPNGSIVTGFPVATGPTDEDLETGQALADLASSAIARADLHESLSIRLKQMETLYRLSGVVVDAAKLPRAFRQLKSLLSDLDVTLDSIAVVKPHVRELVGARAPDGEEQRAIAGWRAELTDGGQARPVPTEGGLLVPVVHRDRVQGTLRLQLGPCGATADENLLLAVAAACGEVMAKTTLRRHLAEGDRQLSIAAERERIARDLHDSVGQILVALGMRITDYLFDASDRVTRDRLTGLLDMAAEGGREMRHAIYSLNFHAARRDDLVASLRELQDKFAGTSGLSCQFEVEGADRRVTRARADAFFHIAHEALMNVVRHARASHVDMRLSYEVDGICLKVRDDGTGLVHRDPFGSGGGHFGIRGMQERMKEAGGTLRVSNVAPRGVLVEACLPTGPRRPR